MAGAQAWAPAAARSEMPRRWSQKEQPQKGSKSLARRSRNQELRGMHHAKVAKDAKGSLEIHLFRPLGTLRPLREAE